MSGACQSSVCGECGVDLSLELNHARRCPYYEEGLDDAGEGGDVDMPESPYVM